MKKGAVVNWEIEMVALLDMSVTACQSHRIAANALWDGIASAQGEPDGALIQKVLTAKLAGEMVGSLESLGALAWSVANRVPDGILRRYLSYPITAIHDLYEEIDNGKELRASLQLPSESVLLSWLKPDDITILTKSLAGLQEVFKAAAQNYRALHGLIVRTYNRIKHGFVVIQGLDKLTPAGVPPTNWRQDVNVLTGIRRNGAIRYTAIERSAENLQQMMKVINMCADAWEELASLIIWLGKHDVPLDAVDPLQSGNYPNQLRSRTPRKGQKP